MNTTMQIVRGRATHAVSILRRSEWGSSNRQKRAVGTPLILLGPLW